MHCVGCAFVIPNGMPLGGQFPTTLAGDRPDCCTEVSSCSKSVEVVVLQATVWHLLGLAGALRDVPGLGSLFALKAGVAEA